MVQIDKNKCIGCGACAKACLSGAIKIDASACAVVNDNCIFCGSCVKICPVDAISMEEVQKDREEKDLSAYKNVWVIMENDSQTQMPKKVSFELLSEGRNLADQLGEELCAVSLCKKISEQSIRDLEYVGCDRLFLTEREELEFYNTDLFSEMITKLICTYKPSIVLFPGTENGRDLAPRISARLKVGLTADCTGLEINEKRELLQIRPTYGGNIIASIITPYHRPQMASVRANVFAVSHCERPIKLEITRFGSDLKLGSQRVVPLGSRPKATAYKDVEEARIVIVGGYGAGKKGFQLIRELALKLDVAVGATRKAVDEGWAPFEIQIGQTGKMIAPEVYLCFGVSGALQHTIGIRGAKKVIAVNNDPTAPIFNISDVAILGDCVAVLESLLQQVERKEKTAFLLRRELCPEN